MRAELYIPGLFPEFDAISAADLDSCSLGQMKKLLGRSKLHTIDVCDYESQMYELFTGESLTSHELPMASLYAGLDNVVQNPGHSDRLRLMRADPVYLYPDTHTLVMQDPEKINLAADEIAMIRDAINPLLDDYDAQLLTPHPHRWYLLFNKECPGLQCTPLHQVLMKSVNDDLPRGDDARRWHTLFNEIQMVLATLEVNVWRQERGEMPVNSLWFWGNGKAPVLSQTNFDCCVSDGDFLKALCHLSKSRFKSLKEGIHVSRYQDSSVITYERLLKASRLNDPQSWLNALEACENEVIAPVVSMIQSGDITEITLITDAGKAFSLNKMGMRSFWKGRQPVSHYLLS